MSQCVEGKKDPGKYSDTEQYFGGKWNDRNESKAEDGKTGYKQRQER